MSQVPLPDSFVRTPRNEYSERVQAARQQMQAVQETPPLQTLDGPAKPAPVQAVAPAPTAPIPAQPVSTAQPAPQPAPQPVAPQPAPVPPQPSYDPALMQQLAAERQRLAEENRAMREAIANLSKDSEELQNLRRQAEINASLAPDAFNDLVSVSPEDAQFISQTVLKAAQQPLMNMQKELEEQRRQLYAAQQQQQQYNNRQRIEQYNQEILRAHPDFYEMQNTPEYKNYMSQRDGLSSKTRDARAAEEFMAGNTAYVIDVLNQIKGQKPAVQDIMTVAPVQTGAPSAPPVQDAAQSRFATLRDLNNAYSMRQISHDDYRQELAKLRTAAAVPSA